MLQQKLQDDQIAALKAGEKDKLSVLRMIISQIKNQEIEKKAGLNDEEVVAVLKKFVKELNESIVAFTKGKRTDLVSETKKQLSIVTPYLPAEISDDELKKEIDKVIKENQSVFDNNRRAIIGICMKALKPKADGSRIMKVLQPLL